MRACVPGLLLSLLLAGPALAAAPLAITYAEQPVHLWRDTSLYSAGRGATLQAHDLVDAGAATLLLDAGGTTVALGPGARLYINGPADLVLLDGWCKVRGAHVQGARLATQHVQFDSTGATVTLHAAPAGTELFAEAGAIVVATPGAARAGVKIAHEQFGSASGPHLTLAPHPPPTFLAALPRAFLDPLTALPVPPPAPPRRERAATYAEVAPLLAGHPALRQRMQRRFKPPAPRRARAAPSSNALF